MSDIESDQSANEELFGTATVVARTGLTAARIRMWEKRYGAVEPQRTETKRRLYTREDLQRLSLLRSLTDAGHAINRIAAHPLDRLRSLAAEEAEVVRRSQPTADSRVLVVSETGNALLGDDSSVDFEWSCPFATLQDALDSPAVPGADLLLIETDTLFEETLDSARLLAERTGARRTLIAYRFATRELEQSVRGDNPDVILLHGQRDAGRLRRECVFQLEALTGRSDMPDAGAIPERLFGSAQLAKLANISTAVDCECPRHLAELLKGLSAFESYSEACEDRNKDDALVHAYLHRTTAQARRSMEDALQHLLKAEGIELG
ncbi:merR family transcriptional regulator protein [Haloferula helveola]|uniref:MerR family transcriptional regulator protein n=1 Tax=Haloferula helveola TaxID=490095 RepID=A0ABN6H5I8_9BACT|nr:merR family transcriptional regulator protein [Haloferula helveola]